MIPDSPTPIVGWRGWYVSYWDGDPWRVRRQAVLDGRRFRLREVGQLTLPSVSPESEVEEVYLASLTGDQIWVPRSQVTAKCKADARAEMHEAPSETCHCGVWAFAAADEAWRTICDADYLHRYTRGVAGTRFPVAVFGEVSLWGKVVLCERGFRAQFAYPRSLYVLNDSFWSGSDQTARRFACDLDAYGVPVSVVRTTEVATLIGVADTVAAGTSAGTGGER